MLRSAMTMSPDSGGVFHVLARHCQLGFGSFGDGHQYVSWIHEHDFVSAVKFLIEREDLAEAINLAAPDPRPFRDFLAELRRPLGLRWAIPLPVWMLEIGTFFLRTETELILKSRRVVPTRLVESGFIFRYPSWQAAAIELVERLRSPNNSHPSNDHEHP
jgi:NAD dependent epimerase/dehydratase family enzyme